MATDDERREVARMLREMGEELGSSVLLWYHIAKILGVRTATDGKTACDRLADLIEPSYKPDAKYEAWYNSLSHYGDERGGPFTIRELIEEIVWAALTVDLGPNGNADPSTGIDEGDVYTSKLFAEWEREALRLSGGIDRDALLELADEMTWCYEGAASAEGDGMVGAWVVMQYADRIREALGVSDD